MSRARVFPLAVVLSALACTSATVLRLDPTLRPETVPSAIQLLGQEPTRPYKVIAIVSARSPGVGEDLAEARKRLLKEAAKLGGHAVLFDNSSVTSVGGDNSERQQLTGKVIVFTDSTGSN